MSAEEALKISAFYRAVDLRSDALGRLPIQVKDLTTRREVEGHYLGRVLWETPNEAMTALIFKKLVEYQRLVLGNAYVWVYRDRHGRPAELLPLPPGTCEPTIEPGTGKLWYMAQDPKTRELYRLDPADMIHLKGFSTDGIQGRSLLSQAALTLRVAQSRDQYERDVYANGGQPSGVLTTQTDLSAKQGVKLPDGTTGSYQDYIRYEWERVHRGPGNQFRVAVLDNSLEYKPISMSLADAQFIEAKTVSVADISRFTGVPLHLLMAGKESYESNAANSTEFAKYCLHPTVVQWEEELSRKLLTASERAKGLWLQINMMAEYRGDTASRREWYKAMLQEGVFSVNDVLALEDMPEVPGGETHRVSLNYVPLENFRELSRERARKGSGGRAAPREDEKKEDSPEQG